MSSTASTSQRLVHELLPAGPGCGRIALDVHVSDHGDGLHYLQPVRGAAPDLVDYRVHLGAVEHR
eukprot:6509781-Pyramimonas_sp.AAC.1